jgi:hypothetical protein
LTFFIYFKAIKLYALRHMYPSLKSQALTGLAVLVCGALSSCGSTDYYSQVVTACGYTPTSESSLTPDCQKALEQVLVFDESSWNQAPTGYKQKVLEAFQALIGYPLVIPADNKLLGISPPNSGVIALAQLETFTEVPNPNQAIFNHILNLTDKIYFDPNDPHAARFAKDTLNPFSSRPRHLTIYPSFWDAQDPSHLTPYAVMRAAILVHEAGHAEGYFHEYCSSGVFAGSFSCDADLSGPVGYAAAYIHFVMQGSAIAQIKTGKPILLSGGAVSALSFYSCDTLEFAVFTKPEALATMLDNMVCDLDADYNWLMKQESK